MKKLVYIGIMFLAVSCGGNDKSGNNNDANESTGGNTSSLDMSEYNIPVSLNVPEEAAVSKAAGVQEMNGVACYNFDIKTDDFRMNVSMMDAEPVEPLDAAIASHKRMSSREKDFSIISEETNGYVYKFSNSKGDNYNFVYILVKDAREIVFTAGPSRSKNWTLEQVNVMYAAAKSAK
ncbi:MAG: hypothetical protein ABIJ16_11155 [Bacteroidota bacterium]